MNLIIKEIYPSFLKDSYDSNKREYPDDNDQIREILVKKNYLSQKDIEHCLNYDISGFSKIRGLKKIETLHQSFRSLYA